MSEELIKRLREQADEIAAAGHNGWGNTMRDAADALSRPAPAVQVPEGYGVAPDWLIELAQPGNWQTGHCGGLVYKLSVSYEAETWKRLMKQLLAAAPAPATVATERECACGPMQYCNVCNPATYRFGSKPATVATEAVAQDEPLTCDDCGAVTPDPWHSSKGSRRHYHRCDACHAKPVAQSGGVDVENVMALADEYAYARYADGKADVDGSSDADEAREKLRALLASPAPAGTVGDGRVAELERILVELVAQVDKKQGYRRVDAPGHAHEIPGIWDSDNGALAGKPCALCAVWREACAVHDAASGNQEARK